MNGIKKVPDPAPPGTDRAVHYGIFLNGGGKNGLIEENIC